MAKASIPNVLGNYLELPNGDVVEVSSKSWFDFLARPDFRSFRFEDGASPYTCRKEKVKGTDGYWYGYQRVSGKVTKRYIGKTSDITQAKLLEVSDRFHVLPNKSPQKLGNIEMSEKLPNGLGNHSTATAHLENELGGELPSDSIDNLLGQFIWKLKDELVQLKAEKEQLEQQLAECRAQLQQKSEAIASRSVEIEPGQVLNQLRQQNKRTKVTLKDVEAIVNLISAD